MIRLVFLIGSCAWWLVAGMERGWWFVGAALVATALTVPVAYWLGEGYGYARKRRSLLGRVAGDGQP